MSAIAETPVNCVAKPLWDGNATATVYNLDGADTSFYNIVMIGVTISRANASISISFTGGQTDPVFADLMVFQVPNPIN